jgi:uncharacterized glyoxalase superfamily metalloenzyme YdcJ
MDDLIFDRLAEMRASAEARAERIYQRGIALEARRRELYERMDAVGRGTVSGTPDAAEAGSGEARAEVVVSSVPDA